MDAIKTKSIPSSNPWEALFISATRLQPALAPVSIPIVNDGKNGASSADDDPTKTGYTQPLTSTTGKGYTIMIQHSMTTKSQRHFALSSTLAMNPDNSRSRPIKITNTPTSQPSRHANQGNWYGISGSFIVRQAFEELCRRCDGAVVFVSVIGASGVLDLKDVQKWGCMNGDGPEVAWPHDGRDNGEEDADDRQLPQQKRWNAMSQFRQNGAWVDLSSDPFGWEGDSSESSCKDYSPTSLFSINSNLNQLQSIADAIRQAALAIQVRSSQALQMQQTSKPQSASMQRPVPIIFESMTPLLHFHGVEKIALLLKSLGRAQPPSSRQLSTIVDSWKGNLTAVSKQELRPPILSPIVAPTLYESLRPADHRLLEDISDSIVSISLMNIQQSAQTKQTSNSVSTAVASGVVDLTRRGGGGGVSLGGKLIRHCLPFHIFKISPKHPGWTTLDARHSCYWEIDYHDGGTVNEKANQAKSQEQNKSELLDANSSKSSSGVSRPQIYLEDNDPEFDDFDEEDPDDDLDL